VLLSFASAPIRNKQRKARSRLVALPDIYLGRKFHMYGKSVTQELVQTVAVINSGMSFGPRP
jgi:hypothetical protein